MDKSDQQLDKYRLTNVLNAAVINNTFVILFVCSDLF